MQKVFVNLRLKAHQGSCSNNPRVNQELNKIINGDNNYEDEAQSPCLCFLCLQNTNMQTFVSAQGLPWIFVSVDVIVKRA